MDSIQSLHALVRASLPPSATTHEVNDRVDALRFAVLLGAAFPVALMLRLAPLVVDLFYSSSSSSSSSARGSAGTTESTKGGVLERLEVWQQKEKGKVDKDGENVNRDVDDVDASSQNQLNQRKVNDNDGGVENHVEKVVLDHQNHEFNHPLYHDQGRESTSSTLRHLISLLSTSLLTCWVFNFQDAFLTLLGSALGTFWWMKSFPGRPGVAFGGVFLVLAWVQGRAQLFPDERWPDFSALMMIMIIKLTSYAFCTFDAHQLKGKLDTYQTSHAIPVGQEPGLLEFLGFALCGVGGWVGPALEFSDYRRWARELPPYDKQSLKGKHDFLPALKCLILGVGMFLLHEKFKDVWHFSLCWREDFLSLPFFSKIGYIMISGLIVRAKFHGAWKISEASGLLSGLGSTLTPEGPTYTQTENVNISKVEFGGSPKVMMDAWNEKTANWLRRYVYVRVRVRWAKLPVTFFMSAFWHGYYPGYYTTFLSSVLMTESARLVRKNLRPIFVGNKSFKPYKPLYDLAGILLSMFALNYLVVSFILRRLDHVLQVWSSLYFCGHLMFLVPFLVKWGGGGRFFGRMHGNSHGEEVSLRKRRGGDVEGKEKRD